MTLTLETTRSIEGNREATLEYEKFGCYTANVYELIGSEWHKTHISNFYKDKAKARAAYKRFAKRYI